MTAKSREISGSELDAARLVCNQISDLPKKLIRGKGEPKGGDIIEQTVGIWHWVADMQDWQFRSLAADCLDELAVGHDAPPSVSDQKIQLGNQEC